MVQTIALFEIIDIWLKTILCIKGAIKVPEILGHSHTNNGFSVTRVTYSSPSLREELLTKGILCKDCHKYLARAHYSVCEKCCKNRMEKLVKSGGMRVLTHELKKQLEKELRV